MDIGFLRDLVIVALGVAVMLVGISMALIGFSVYRSANAILKSGKATAAALEATRLGGLDAHARLPTFLATYSPS